MSPTASIEIPLEVPHATRMELKDFVIELAVVLFQQGKLSFGKAREIADMKVWSFQQLLGSREIPIHYDVEDYQEDFETLAKSFECWTLISSSVRISSGPIGACLVSECSPAWLRDSHKNLAALFQSCGF